MVEVRRSDDVDGFLATAGAFLGAREAEHNLIFGICSQLRSTPDPTAVTPYLGVAMEDGWVVAAAIRTPPHNLVLSETDELATIEPLARDIHEVFGSLPGVLGPRTTVASFAERWCELVGVGMERAMQERIYQASTATPPTGVAGTMRAIRDDDHGLVRTWLSAFMIEAFPAGFERDPVEVVLRRRLNDPSGGLVLWETGDGPVSLAGFGGLTPNGIRIGPVYTPPDQRGRGYASALVGSMTQMLLARGYRFCFLFTDLANPTSNSIYQRVGYIPVADVDEYLFA